MWDDIDDFFDIYYDINNYDYCILIMNYIIDDNDDFSFIWYYIFIGWYWIIL